MTLGAVASTEFLRFLRRREGAILPLALAALGALPIVAAIFESVVFASWARAVVSVAEIPIAAMLAHVLAATSLSYEHRRGSWPLLIQSAATPGRILAGKALGVLGCVTLLHLCFQLMLVATTPLVTREPAAVAVEALLPLLAAIVALPGGLAEAQVRRAGKHYGAFRLINLLQWTSPLVILAAFLAPLGLPAATDALQDLLSTMAASPMLSVLREALPSPVLFVGLVALTQAALAVLTWRLFVNNPRFA